MISQLKLKNHQKYAETRWELKKKEFETNRKNGFISFEGIESSNLSPEVFELLNSSISLIRNDPSNIDNWNHCKTGIISIKRNFGSANFRVRAFYFSNFITSLLKVKNTSIILSEILILLSEIVEYYLPSMSYGFFSAFLDHLIDGKLTLEAASKSLKIISAMLEDSEKILVEIFQSKAMPWIAKLLQELSMTVDIDSLNHCLFYLSRIQNHCIGETKMKKNSYDSQQICLMLKQLIASEQEVLLSFVLLVQLLNDEPNQEVLEEFDQQFVQNCLNRSLVKVISSDFVLPGIQFLTTLIVSKKLNVEILSIFEEDIFYDNLKNMVSSNNKELVHSCVNLIDLMLRLDCVKISKKMELYLIPDELLAVLLHEDTVVIIRNCLLFFYSYGIFACPAFSHLIKNPTIIFEVLFEKIEQKELQKMEFIGQILSIFRIFFERGKIEAQRSKNNVNKICLDFIENGFLSRLLNVQMASNASTTTKIDQIISEYFEFDIEV